MRVVALVEYEVLGDNEYAYVERYEAEYGGGAHCVLRVIVSRLCLRLHPIRICGMQRIRCRLAM